MKRTLKVSDLIGIIKGARNRTEYKKLMDVKRALSGGLIVARWDDKTREMEVIPTPSLRHKMNDHGFNVPIGSFKV